MKTKEKIITSVPHKDGHTKVQVNFLGCDTHAFSIMGFFKKKAREQGFNSDWIEEVFTIAMDGDYDHVLGTCLKHSTTEDIRKEEVVDVPLPKDVQTDVDSDDYSALYWEKKGKYQELQDKYWDMLIPTQGARRDEDDKLIIHAELLRMINRLCYDIYNNGLCNDKSDEVEFLMAHEQLFSSYFEHEGESENFNKFCHYYREQLKREEEHEPYEYIDCYECQGSGEVDCYDEEQEYETCDECGGGGEIMEDNELCGIDWLGDYFTPARQRMLDRTMDAILLYVDAVENGTHKGKL